MKKYKAFSENWCEDYNTLKELKKDLINWGLEVGEEVAVRDRNYELRYVITVKENDEFDIRKIY